VYNYLKKTISHDELKFKNEKLLFLLVLATVLNVALQEFVLAKS
jgi:hypothetical protein|tara:strand:+ start:761 stop:892 length:132 start_codon:yes stop_codon:yes gene_type:complete